MRAVLAHSPVLQSAENEERAADARAAQALAGGRPTLTADARASHFWGLSDQQLGPQIVIPGISDRYNAGVQAAQPLYAGGRVRGQRVSTALAHEAAGQTRRSTEADVTYAALGAYWSWSQAFYAVGSFRAAVARVERHNTDMQNEFKAGLATESDALATTVQMENTRLRLAEAERRVELARARIAYLTGHELPAQTAPQAATGAAADSIPAEKDLLDQARTNRAVAIARRLDVRAASEQVEVARADRRPQFAAVARYEQARPNVLDIPPEDQWNYAAFVGLTASWNIWDSGLTRAKVAEATARREQARQRQQQTDDQIALDVRAARVNLANAAERLTVTQRVAESARRNLQVADDLWKNGLTRHVDLLDAHAKLTDAEAQVITTRAEVELARAELEHAIGKLGTEK